MKRYKIETEAVLVPGTNSWVARDVIDNAPRYYDRITDAAEAALIERSEGYVTYMMDLYTRTGWSIGRRSDRADLAARVERAGRRDRRAQNDKLVAALRD